MESVPIDVSLQLWGKNAFSSVANTFSLEIVIPIFIGHVLVNNIGQPQNIFIFVATHACCCHSKTNTLCFTLLVEGSFLFISLYMRIKVPQCLLVPTLVLHKVHVMACVAQHLLVELGWQPYNVQLGIRIVNL